MFIWKASLIYQRIKNSIFDKTNFVKYFLFCLWSVIPLILRSQSIPYFQQEVNYQIQAQLKTIDETLDGNIQVIYKNNSPDTLHFIWFHLWPNAFKNDKTDFSEQLLKNGNTSFYFSDNEKRGYINRLNFNVNGATVSTEDHPSYFDVVKLILPSPLNPGDSAIIETPFHEKIPFLWSQEGYDENFFSLVNWYPQPAVYDKDGWHPMPYLDQGGNYNEFGNYHVEISMPSSYEIAASGNQTESNVEGRNKNLKFTGENISSFSFFAFKNYRIDSGEITSEDGHKIKIYSYYRKDSAANWKKSISFLEDAIHYFEKEIGTYPYNSIKLIQAPKAFHENRSYSGVVLVRDAANEKEMDEAIYKAVGGMFFSEILSPDTRSSPWMANALNTFFTNKYIDSKYRSKNNAEENFFKKRTPENMANFTYRMQLATKEDQPLSTHADSFSRRNFNTITSVKGGLWMQQLQKLHGNNFGTTIKSFYNDWRFRHPDINDFKNEINENNNIPVDSLFELLNKKGHLSQPQKKEFKLASFYSLRNTDKYNYLFVSPSVGFNYYDKLMVGALVHNYTLPEPSFHFLFAPMYGTGSHSFTGLGRIGYSLTSYGFIRKAELAISGERYNMDEFTDSTGKKNFMNFTKIVPSLTLHFRQKNITKKVDEFIQWKTYLITEHSLLFTYDSVLQTNVITYPKSSYYINQLQFVHRNDRALYPFTYNLQLQQSTGFLRFAAEGNMFFNYVKEGGLNVRLFAGKFMYLGDKTITKEFETSRYHLNLTGADGYEDYTYSNYFLGRNEFHGLPMQQIMIRDGGFKVRTDLLADKVGQTDNWLAAANLNTTIPKEFNPLSVLPFKINLKAFLDVGTYAEAWQNNAATGRFLFDAGLQLSVIKDLLNVYIPIAYSKVYGDYFKSTIPKNKRFWTKISFSIDIQNFRLKKIFNY